VCELAGGCHTGFVGEVDGRRGCADVWDTACTNVKSLFGDGTKETHQQDQTSGLVSAPLKQWNP
jgi:hypothetical protein